MQLIDGYLVFSDVRYFEIRLILLACLLVAAAVIDLRQRRIPNLLVLSGLLIAFAGHLIFPSDIGWRRAVYGMVLGFSVLLPFYLLRGMAAGDVKLMAMVGAFLGPQLTLMAIVMTFLVGGVWAVLVISRSHAWSGVLANLRNLAHSAVKRNQGQPAASLSLATGSTSVGRIPYGAVIAVGTGAALLAVRHGVFL